MIETTQGIPPQEALFKLNRIDKDEFFEKIKNIPKRRIEILFAIINNQLPIDFPEIWDIQWYALKSLFPEYYNSLKNKKHPYCIDNPLYEYDPPKNGCNIIKHGISFGEVIDYSSNFGKLMVSCDNGIIAILSTCNNNLLPLNFDKKDIDVLSIVTMSNDRFRFISSRTLGGDGRKIEKTFLQAFKGIYPDDSDKKQKFIERCMEIFKPQIKNIQKTL